MPELAEVEKVRKLVESHALNKKIIKAKAFEDEIVFLKKTPNEIEKAVKNSTVKKVLRKGKIFWMELNGTKNTRNISFHLGMTGRMIVRGNKDITTYYRYPDKNMINNWPPRFVKLLLIFDDKTEMAFTNTRRLGRVRIHCDLPINEEPINKLGIDPLNKMCSLNQFKNMILKRKCPLKSALLNQSFTAGIGNWIADEVCYQSGIYPGKYCNTLTQIQIQQIYHSIINIVKYAVNVNANYDKFPNNWLFHYRWNKAKKSPKKNKKKSDDNEFLNAHSDSFGNKIEYEQIGGRTTAIVWKLQSKENGYRQFKDSKNVGKIISYKDKLKRKNKYILLNDDDDTNNNDTNDNDTKNKNTNNTKSNNTKKRKSNNIKSECIDDGPSKKRQKTHVPLIPIELLRRSTRIRNKNNK